MSKTMKHFLINIEHYDNSTDTEHTTKMKCNYVNFEQALQYVAYEVLKIEGLGHDINNVNVDIDFEIEVGYENY